jgi:hypothetical protein
MLALIGGRAPHLHVSPGSRLRHLALLALALTAS